MAGMFSKKVGIISKLNDMKKDIPIILLTGVVYAVVQLFTAGYIGPQLPCLLAAGAALVVYVTIEICSGGTGGTTLGVRYTLPFVLLITLLMVIRLVPGVETFLEGGFSDETIGQFLNPYILNINAPGVVFKRRFPWLAHSGIIVLFVSILTPCLVPYRPVTDKTLTAKGTDTPFVESTKRTKVTFAAAAHKVILELRTISNFKVSPINRAKHVYYKALIDSIMEALPVMVSIGSYASLAKVMSQFQMTQTIAFAIVRVLSGMPGVYTVMIPIIGMMGSGLTGSTTTSNFLFGQLQVQTAIDLGIITATKNSVWEIAAIQILGATAGEIISPMNAVFSTVLLSGRFPESDLIKLVIPIFIVWLMCCCLTSFLFLLV